MLDAAGTRWLTILITSWRPRQPPSTWEGSERIPSRRYNEARSSAAMRKRCATGMMVINGNTDRPSPETNLGAGVLDPSDRLRILYVTSHFPFPLTTGFLRHYFMIKELSSRHDIRLLSLVGPDFGPDDAAAMVPYTRSIETFAPSHPAGSVRKAIRRLGQLANLMHVGQEARQLRSAVRSLVGENAFDVVLLAGHLSPICDLIGRIPLVIDVCDTNSARIRGQMVVANSLQVPGLLGRLMATRRVEARKAADANHLLFATTRDRAAFLPGRQLPSSTIVPNGIDLNYWRRQTKSTTGSAVVFTGAMDYPPNEDAALQLVREIMPLVWSRVPSARLILAGRDPSPRLISAANNSHVTVTGRVPDIRPYLEAASVYAAPIRFASGIQNKLLEALAMEVPVVSSSVGFEGLRTEDGEAPPMQFTDDVLEASDQIVEHLERSSRDPTTAPAGRQYVSRHFQWPASARKEEAALHGAIRDAAQGGAEPGLINRDQSA